MKGIMVYERNATANRFNHKTSKRDIENSNARLKMKNEKYRFVSNKREVPMGAVPVGYEQLLQAGIAPFHFHTQKICQFNKQV